MTAFTTRGIDADRRRADALLRGARLAGLCIFAAWVAFYMRNGEPLLHGSLLIFHEAGHVLFMPFGEFVMVLGGSAFQLLVPAFFIGYFLHRRDGFAACFAALYLAASIAGVAEYIADARTGELPLLGGERSNHDWTFLLIELEMLERDIVIGRFVDRVAVMVWLVALALGLRLAWVVRPPATQPATREHRVHAADARNEQPARRSP
jgi:hypothetical protein